MLENNREYFALLENVKNQIKSTQYKAVVAVNKEMISLYWNIGKIILKNISWGNKFIENLARDIKNDFPNSKGYSVRNLKYMRKFAEEFADFDFVQTVSAQLTWFHITIIMDKVKDYDIKVWYIQKAIENGWSGRILEMQISTELYERQAIAGKTNNFDLKLPSPQSELAIESMKDPYIFDFISLSEDIKERDIEKQLVKNVTKLLLELGTGFAFLGNQYHLEVSGSDYYIDLLFYNLQLRCYVIIELKTGTFKPEYAGKINFYLSAVDDLLKKETDNSSIGLILCRNKNTLIAEYALKDMTKPIGVSEFKLLEEVTRELKARLPDIEK